MAEETKKPSRTEDFADYITEPLKRWYSYIKDNALSYYCQLLKISLLSTFVSLALLLLFGLVFGGIVMAVGGVGVLSGVLDSLGTAVAFVIFGLFLVAALFITVWIRSSISLTAIVFTDTVFRKRGFSIIEAFNAIKGRVFRFLVLRWAILFILMLPLLLLFGFIAYQWTTAEGSQDPGAVIAALVLQLLFAITIGVLYYILVAILYTFLLQFWTYGFLVGGLSVVEAFKQSIRIIKRRFLEVLAFDIIWYVGLVVFSIPATIYGVFFEFLGRVFLAFVEFLVPFGWVLIFPALLIHVLISVALSTVAQTFGLPTHYLFWRKANQ